MLNKAQDAIADFLRDVQTGMVRDVDTFFQRLQTDILPLLVGDTKEVLDGAQSLLLTLDETVRKLKTDVGTSLGELNATLAELQRLCEVARLLLAALHAKGLRITIPD